MFLLPFDKLYLLILGIGFIVSLSFPSTSFVNSPKFLCIYLAVILSSTYSLLMAVRHGVGNEIITTIFIGVSFIIVLPVIKIYFS